MIEARLGAGGMGEVYRARDTRLQRTVAVKVVAARGDPGRDAAGPTALAIAILAALIVGATLGRSGPAIVLVALGETDRAFDWLERAYQERSYLMPYLNLWPELDPIRSDPRFRNLVRRVGLPDASAPRLDPAAAATGRRR